MLTHFVVDVVRQKRQVVARTTLARRKGPIEDRAQHPKQPEGTQQQVQKRWYVAIGQSLSSPLAILLLLPIFACGIGILMAWQGHLALHTVIDGISRDRFFSQSKQAVRRTRQILRQAPVLQARWQRFLQRNNGVPPLDKMGQHLVDLMSQREGISWISYGRDDGKFWGVFRNLKGEYILSQRFVLPNGFNDLKDYRVSPKGLHLVRHKPRFKYDHRVRKWYKIALRNRQLNWTKPYTFFASGAPGISSVKQIVTKGVRGVTTVDYSLNTLSKFVEKLNASQQGSVFLFTQERVLLAFPGGRHKMMGLDGKGLARMPKASAHPDPILRAFFETPNIRRLHRRKARQFEFMHQHSRIFGSIMPSSIDQNLTWYVGAFIPRAKLVAPVQKHKRDALEIALLTLFLSLQLAGLLSWRVWRNRAALKRAHQATQQAEREAYELGSYSLVKCVGGGGMGEVWEAEHQMLARPAAIKLIRSEIMTSGQHDPELILKHFEREAKATARLSSPHTVRLYDYGTSDDGHFFYVMELLQGLDVRQLVLSQGPQHTGRVVHVLKQICMSLAEAHNNGLVHRDLKPANVFLCAQGTQLDFVKVLDFGVVHIDSDPELDSQAVGTPSIMAPEQIHGNQPIDGRTDLYAVGCLAHWMLTGSNVFGDDSVSKVLERHLREPPPSPREGARFPIPDELEELVLGCLAKNQQHRPANAETLLRMLDAVPIPKTQLWDDEAIQAWWSTHFSALQAVGWHAHGLEERLLTTPVPAAHPTLKTPAPVQISPSETERIAIKPSLFVARESQNTVNESGFTIRTLHKTAPLKKK